MGSLAFNEGTYAMIVSGAGSIDMDQTSEHILIDDLPPLSAQIKEFVENPCYFHGSEFDEEITSVIGGQDRWVAFDGTEDDGSNEKEHKCEMLMKRGLDSIRTDCKEQQNIDCLPMELPAALKDVLEAEAPRIYLVGETARTITWVEMFLESTTDTHDLFDAMEVLEGLKHPTLMELR